MSPEAWPGAGKELRVLYALAFAGPTVPLAQLAGATGYSRKHTGRMLDRLAARGILAATETIRRSWAECTHTKLRGVAGRKECERLRRQAGIEGGCVAHHGHALRTLAPGLTKADLVRALAMPSAEVTTRVHELQERRQHERRARGVAGNDYEGRELQGKASARGPRGTNHTSRRHPRSSSPLADVTPIPPGGSLEIERSASSGRVRGDVAPPAPGLSCVADAGDDGAPGRQAAVREGEHGSSQERQAPAALPAADPARIARNRETARNRDYLLKAWKLAGLPALTEDERRKVAWCRAAVFGIEDLALAVACAVREWKRGHANPWRRVFARSETLHEFIHEERARRTVSGAPRTAIPRATTPERAKNAVFLELVEIARRDGRDDAWISEQLATITGEPPSPLESLAREAAAKLTKDSAAELLADLGNVPIVRVRALQDPE